MSENHQQPQVARKIRKASRIAEEASIILNEPVTTSMIHAWIGAGKIRGRKLGHHHVVDFDELVEDLSGKAPQD